MRLFRSRTAIRTRLTLLYGASLVAASLAQTAVMYLVMRASVLRPIPDIPEDGGRPFNAPEGARQALDDFRNSVLRDLLLQSTITGLIIAAAAMALGWWLAGRALEPIHQIAATAERVSEGSLHERIDISGPDDELRELADTFDAMLDRLERSFESQRRFVANASHELRTPLAVEKTLLEVEMSAPDASDDLKRVGTQLLQIQDKNERLIHALLALANSAQPLTREDIDLAPFTNAAIQAAAPQIADAQLTISTDNEPAPTNGDPELLAQLVENLIANAISYNAVGGWIRTHTSTRPGDQVQLIVENSGPGVATSNLENLFQPFSRGQDRTGRGVGLGLSICRSITEAHNGTITAQRNDSGGLTLTVELPTSPK